MENTERAVQTLRRVLAEVGWDGDPDEDGRTWTVDLGPPHVPVSEVVLSIDEDVQSFMFMAYLAPDAPERTRDAVMRRVTRVNWELAHGNFELDLEDGMLRYRVTLGFCGSELVDTTLRQTIFCAMEVLEAHADALSSLASGRTRIETPIPEFVFHG